MDAVLRIHPIETLERQRDHDFTLRGYQSDRLTPAAIVSGDVVRFKVWDAADVDGDPTIDLDSVALPSATFTADVGTDFLTSTAHGLANGQRVKLSSSGALPAGLSGAIVYYVVAKTTDTYQVALTSGGAAVDLTDTGSGAHTWTRVYSTITIDGFGVEGDTPFEVTVALYRDEINLLAVGEWNWEGSVVKPSEDNRVFVFARGTFDVVANSAGDLGTT